MLLLPSRVGLPLNSQGPPLLASLLAATEGSSSVLKCVWRLLPAGEQSYSSKRTAGSHSRHQLIPAAHRRCGNQACAMALYAMLPDLLHVKAFSESLSNYVLAAFVATPCLAAIRAPLRQSCILQTGVGTATQHSANSWHSGILQNLLHPHIYYIWHADCTARQRQHDAADISSLYPKGFEQP